MTSINNNFFLYYYYLYSFSPPVKNEQHQTSNTPRVSLLLRGQHPLSLSFSTLLSFYFLSLILATYLELLERLNNFYWATHEEEDQPFAISGIFEFLRKTLHVVVFWNRFHKSIIYRILDSRCTIMMVMWKYRMNGLNKRCVEQILTFLRFFATAELSLEIQNFYK